MSPGPMPADSNAARAASAVGPGATWGASHGLKTSNVPNRRVRNSTARSSIELPVIARAFSVDVKTIAAPPSLGLQNMYVVSGSLTIGAEAISSADNAFRRQACGVIEPLRNALAAI